MDADDKYHLSDEASQSKAIMSFTSLNTIRVYIHYWFGHQNLYLRSKMFK